VAHQLQQLGYQDVKILKGGLTAWANAGLPLEPKSAN
jgi:rhodanese-related sulfurtransferase